MTVGFFGGGLLLLCAMLAAAWGWLRSRPRGRASGSVVQVGFRNAAARPGRSVLCIELIASAAFIIVAVDAFRREGVGDTRNPASGTGGYPLLADTLLPIAHDTATSEGRDALNIADLWEADGALDGVTLTRFRVRPGEDASCLNLYQAKDPRGLAPTDAFVSAGRFSFLASAAETAEEEANPWLRVGELHVGEGGVMSELAKQECVPCKRGVPLPRLGAARTPVSARALPLDRIPDRDLPVLEDRRVNAAAPSLTALAVRRAEVRPL